MKNQVDIFSFLIFSFFIFSFFLFIFYIWTTTVSNIQKLAQKEVVEYFKECIELSTLIQLSNCKYCISSMTLRTSTILPTRTQQSLVITDSIKYFFGEEILNSSFYNFSSNFNIQANAISSKNINILINSFDKQIKIES